VRIPLPNGHHISATRIFRLISQLSHRRVEPSGAVQVRLRMTPPGRPDVVELSGEIDAATTAEFWTHLEQVPTTADVLVDLSGVRFMGAAGLTLLLRFRQRLTDADAPLRLTGASRMVRTMITLVGLQDDLRCAAESDQPV
jgi:anti-anti-sigma factor